MKKKIRIKEFAEALRLTPVYDTKREEFEIDTSDLNRPGMQMCGIFDYFADNRVQLFGMVEMTYLQTLDEHTLRQRIGKYFSYPIPCIIIARNLTPPSEFLQEAKKHDVPVFISGLTTTKLGHQAIFYLDNELAPVISRHGGLLDVFGIGVYITGDSGVGKSETALELLNRGHRIIADDVVEIRKIADSQLIGRAPEIIRHFMEIRGIGIIDVSVLYGMGSVMLEKEIDMCINLELGDGKDIDRLGRNANYITLLGVNVPKVTIPVRPGRNIAIITEVAAMNFRMQSKEYSADRKMDSRMLNLLGMQD
jgi:HPr kinase/phosphorylase